ncbi:MAG: SpoIIE family protein phosphatase, partial [Myxococcales bacterium]|nr:SpoIIE family protein phosphatase [Myxococcales bacterium]
RALYLFTDGVTESRVGRGEMLGLEGLQRAIQDCSGQPLRERLGTLLGLTARGQAHDDVTWLIVEPARSGSVPGLILHHAFRAEPEALHAVRERVSAACAEAGCGPSCSQDVVLAVDEACQNVFRHAYGGEPGDVVLEIARDGDRLVVYLRDFADPVDPERIRPRSLDDVRPGGLGTHFIRELMDEHEFLAPGSGSGNLLRMQKRIAGR